MRGAILITLAQLVTKVLGAIHRPVAQHFIGDAGLALATPPSNAYYTILAVSSVGLNVAISRLVSDRLALEDYRGARKVFQVAARMLVISGIIFSVLFALGAHWMAAYQEVPDSWLGFLVLSPALFFVALLCVFRGLYQGMQQMQESALSQVVEQVARVSLSLAIIAVVSHNVRWGAAAFNAGNPIGIFLAVCYFVWIYFRQRPTANWTTVAPGVESYENESVSSLMGKILAIAAPLAFMGAVLPVMGMVDTKFVVQQLTAQGVSQNLAEQAQAWLANAGTLRDLPTILTTAFYISLVPSIAEAFATDRLDQARYRTATAFRMTLLIGIPATVGLLVGARDVYGVLYKGTGYTVLAPLALSTIFMMLQQTASGALQGMGRIWLSVRNMLIGVVVKIGLTWWLAGIPSLQERGAALATVACFVVAASLQLWALREHMGFTLNLRQEALRPLTASALMGVAIWATSSLLHRVLPSPRIAGVLVIGLGGLVYLVALMAMGGLTMADLKVIPGMPAGLADWLQRKRLLRD
ncbi:MAG TPA: polysaccharide biosynthesis protein [Symbiobacteriaceae bacterium]|jgi:stage V sporulation protein B|nr:polysaccharide biosynthesis protein [Symbiobacteriaceae bacterium]